MSQSHRLLQLLYSTAPNTMSPCTETASSQSAHCSSWLSCSGVNCKDSTTEWKQSLHRCTFTGRINGAIVAATIAATNWRLFQKIARRQSWRVRACLSVKFRDFFGVRFERQRVDKKTTHIHESCSMQTLCLTILNISGKYHQNRSLLFRAIPLIQSWRVFLRRSVWVWE